ncbi:MULTISPECIES: hypothetical protein [unclassified Mesorhizobium]|uniref:hypothetical protein n=1 Tax=unclassified Mesorhizobium TaxID=325217 RepID=UPI0013E09C20|nr:MULTISPECIES: hypothetical protein [unclassified Mesorhizobium]MCT2579103.1 hypothetical protein [Mesorhizobium sp. P13.3]MDF3168042.1 hypothetical protein [Mesorhizobium sp. P16.1]MDF3180050.1 hypothetical protein [Mesorhizobium sp. P17.1]MDF3184956.1 hypothetical protein [Mesorhizobium sp. ICCV3110.1]
MKLLHAFEKFEEFERLGDGQFEPFQFGYALPLLSEVPSTQANMPAHHADVICKRH